MGESERYSGYFRITGRYKVFDKFSNNNPVHYPFPLTLLRHFKGCLYDA
jgi:hypothetical protein